MAEHLGHIQVERLHAVALFEREVGIAGSFTNYIHRGALALSNLLHVLYVFFVYQQTHALLTLVGNNLLRRQRLVANGQFSHVYLATTLSHEFR